MLNSKKNSDTSVKSRPFAGTKKLLIALFASCITASVTAQNPVPNPSFENWAGGNPVSWSSNNIPTTIYIPITQTTPGQSGSYAVKGEVIAAPTGNLTPYLTSTDMTGMGFPVSQLYATFSFYYKFNQVGSSQLVANAVIYDGASAVQGAAAQNIGTPSASFSYSAVPFFNFGTSPATATIFFALIDSLGATMSPANFFVIDDVSLSGTTGINNNENVLAITKVQPNPASDLMWVYYNVDKLTNVALRLYEVTGKVLSETILNNETPGKHKMEIDVSNMPAGFYFLKIETEDGTVAYPVQVLH